MFAACVNKKVRLIDIRRFLFVLIRFIIITLSKTDLSPERIRDTSGVLRKLRGESFLGSWICLYVHSANMQSLSGPSLHVVRRSLTFLKKEIVSHIGQYNGAPRRITGGKRASESFSPEAPQACLAHGLWLFIIFNTNLKLLNAFDASRSFYIL